MNLTTEQWAKLYWGVDDDETDRIVDAMTEALEDVFICAVYEDEEDEA